MDIRLQRVIASREDKPPWEAPCILDVRSLTEVVRAQGPHKLSGPSDEDGRRAPLAV